MRDRKMIQNIYIIHSTNEIKMGHPMYQVLHLMSYLITVVLWTIGHGHNLLFEQAHTLV